MAAMPLRSIPRSHPRKVGEGRREIARGWQRRRVVQNRRGVRRNAGSKLDHTTDIVVIGSGIGGLCAGALLAKYGNSVSVFEAHGIAGGACHAWERDGYTFESGPSLYSGIASGHQTTNPLGQVLSTLGEEVKCVNYNTWMCHLPDMGSFSTRVGDDGKQFEEILARMRSQKAVREWRNLREVMKPLADAASAVPAFAVRQDIGAILSLGSCLPKLVGVSPLAIQGLLKPYSEVMRGVVTDDFLTDWLDMLCFLLSGRGADDTLTAEIGFMFEEWYRPSASLEFPIGGSQAIVDALVSGLRKNNGKLYLNSKVDEIITENGKAVGVRLLDGSTVLARTAVVANCSIWDTQTLLKDPYSAQALKEQTTAIKDCNSFMHLHLGFDGTGLDLTDIHHIFVQDWARGVTNEQNLVLVSIPSILDPSLAPTGKHVLHAYTPGSEPYEIWDGLDRKSDEYRKLKRERSQVLWEAVSKAIPDIRDRVEIEMIGTPLTHKRFLNRHRGTYGGYGWLGSGEAAPSPKSGVESLLLVGDSNFPGPGLPSVAAGGIIAANSLTPVWQQLPELAKILSP